MQSETHAVIERLLEDHQRVAAIVRRLEPFLERERAPIEPDFAHLRWSLLREFTRHHAVERVVLLRNARSSAAAATSDRDLAAALSEHMVEWTATAIHRHWPRYRTAARSLLNRMRRQMQHEEAIVFPTLR